jgi:hypothetical protein
MYPTDAMFFDDEPTEVNGIPRIKTFTYVKVGRVWGRLAICEKATGEPLQFVTSQSPDPVYLERLAAGWESYYQNIREKL